MTAFADRLRCARDRAGLTQLQLARALGVTASTYCGYETGKRQPDVRKLRRLALLLRVSGDELLGLPRALPAVSEAEQALLSRVRALDAHGRRMLELVLAEELARAEAEPGAGDVLFRISEQPAAAGLGAYLGPDAFRLARVSAGALPRGASFGVPVQGDSMEPKFHDRDILIVSDLPPEPGDVGVFVMDGSGYVKQLGEGELLSLNPAYAPIPMTDSIRACGTVLGVLSPSDILD